MGVEDIAAYRKAVEKIFDLRFYCVKEGLKKITFLLKLMGNPHKDLKIIRVVGTNGKGSVSSMLSSILVEAGYRVGMNTSPHLQEFTERIRIDGTEISRDDVVALYKKIYPLIEKMKQDPEMGGPTYFEVTTAMALEYFRRQKVDLTILEAGIGGKSDGTQVANSILVVITRIAMDHADKLGESIEGIIEDKAGAVPLGGICVSCNPPEVLQVIERVTEDKYASFESIKPSDIRISRSGPGGTVFSFATRQQEYEKLTVPFAGDFQAENGALAVLAAEELVRKKYTISENHIRNGLAKCRWPGRMDILHERPLVLADCAHNPNAVEQLIRGLREYNYDRLHLVFGVCEEKAIQKLVDMILPVANTLIFTKTRVERAVPPEVLAGMTMRESKQTDNTEKALSDALKIARAEDMILVCGSVYLVGEAMDFFERMVAKGAVPPQLGRDV